MLTNNEVIKINNMLEKCNFTLKQYLELDDFMKKFYLQKFNIIGDTITQYITKYRSI